MAWQMKLKLPVFKVTQRSPSGVVRRNISRGKKSVECSASGSEHTNAAEESSSALDSGSSPINPLCTLEPSLDDYDDRGQNASLYAIKQKSSTLAWANIRQGLLTAAVENSAMPINQHCVMCPSEAVYRCVQCSPCAYYCHACFGQAHTSVNIFHTGEVWEDGMYKPVIISDRLIDVRVQHECASVSSVPLCCIDANGCEHNLRFVYCSCEPLPITMVRARLWPATPLNPRLAFCFELLDWAEALLLECQVALKDLCKAISFKCPHLVIKRRTYYAAMIDSFEEYRCMKVELRHLHFLCPDLDMGNVCPACPKKSGQVVLSMDALFGLPRKKSAGHSLREAIHGHLFFRDQSLVDEFVALTQSKHNKSQKHCSDFVAGDMLRSSQRFHALDETAVFGTACRHEFPHMFLNLKHGERIAYAVWLLREVAHHYSSEIHISVMYDVACTLVQHLKANGAEKRLLSMKYAVPAFHAYAHIPSCQILYSPQRCEGFGLSDGEVMERLWSYLRRFSRMTKEMRPAHRLDILAHALLYYGYMRKQTLASLLVQRWNKAKGIKDIAIERFSNLSSQSSVLITEDLVEQWIEAEKAVILSTVERTTEWKPHYVHMLESYYATRNNEISALPEDVLSLHKKLFSIESQLADIEHKRGIKQHWKPTDIEFVDTKNCSLLSKQQAIYSSLRTSIVKRQYLLQLKAKYADGQKIAKRLSVGITKETVIARKLLSDYNTCCLVANGIPVALEEVVSPDAVFWQNSMLATPISSTPSWNVKKDIIQAYLLIKRCEEELLLLSEEKKNVLAYWAYQKEAVQQQLATMYVTDPCTLYTSGARALLLKYQWEVDLMHSNTLALFSADDVHVDSPGNEDCSPYDSDLESLILSDVDCEDD